MAESFADRLPPGPFRDFLPGASFGRVGAVGLYLVGLYLNLESLSVALQVRPAFEKARA